MNSNFSTNITMILSLNMPQAHKQPTRFFKSLCFKLIHIGLIFQKEVEEIFDTLIMLTVFINTLHLIIGRQNFNLAIYTSGQEFMSCK